MFSASTITTVNPAITAKQQIARIARRIIARNYGLIDQILNIAVEPTGLIKVWFQDDDVERSVILMTIGDTVEYRDVTNRRTDSIDSPVDWYIVGFANTIGSREDAIRKPKNCKKGTPCKGECIPKGSVCRDIPMAKDEAIAINEAVAKSVPQQTEPVNDDPYRDLNIRQLKEVARDKGVMRYSYMTQSQLRDAINVYDANPDYREDLRKGLQRQKDQAALKKVKSTEIGRAISTFNPKFGRQFNLINAISKKYENNKIEARIYGLAVILSTSALIVKTMEKRRNDNLNKAKVMAATNASNIRESTPDVEEPSVSFVIGSYKNGSNALVESIRNSNNISEEDKGWFNNETKVIPFIRSKEGVSKPSDPLRSFADNFTTGYKAVIGDPINNGKGEEAINLASQLYVYGSKYSPDRDGLLSSPALNIFAGEDGGTVARDAIEILRKMPKSPDSNGIRGADIADRVRLVTMGTPYFGLSKPDIPELNIMGLGDLWNLTPFTKGGNETKKVPGVGSSGQSSYVESSDVMTMAFNHLRTVEDARRKINAESIKARDAVIKAQENLFKSEADRAKTESERAARDQVKASETKALADRVKVEIENLSRVAGKTFAQFIKDNPSIINDITAKTKKKIREELARQRGGDEVRKIFNNDSDIYLSGRSDAFKKIKCKIGFIQRGSACQRQKKNTENDVTQSSDNKKKAIKVLKKGAKVAAIGAGVITVATASLMIAHIASRGEVQTEGLNTISKKELKDYTDAGIPPAEGFTGKVTFIKSPTGEIFVKKESKGAIGYVTYQASKEAVVSNIALENGISHVKVKLVTDVLRPISLQSMAIGKDLEKLIKGGEHPKIDLQQKDQSNQAWNAKFTKDTLSAMSSHPDLAKIAALDTFVGNLDRHSGNLFYDQKSDRYTAIDSAWAFDFNASRAAKKFFEDLDFSSLSAEEKSGIEEYSKTMRTLVRNNPPKKTKGSIYGYAAKSGENVFTNAFREMYSRQKIDESYQDSLGLLRTLDSKLYPQRRTQQKAYQDSSVYEASFNQAKTDAYKKLRCKSGYVQRGSACQKEKASLGDPSSTNADSGVASNILKYGLPIASVAAISLAGKEIFDVTSNVKEVVNKAKTTGNVLKYGVPIASAVMVGKTVAKDIKKATVKLGSNDVVIKAGEPVPKELLDVYEKEFKAGDLIKRKSLNNGVYIEHYGIYAGEGKIIETFAQGKFGGSTLIKDDIGRPLSSNTTQYTKVEDISGKASPVSKDQALKLAESMIGVPFKFDVVNTNCESIARAITQGEARSSQSENLSWLTKSIAKKAIAIAPPVKNLNKGYTAKEVQDLLSKNNYDPVLVKAVFADSATKRKQDIEKANRGDSIETSALRSPDEFTEIVKKTVDPLNGVTKSIVEQQMYKAYLVAAIALTSQKD